MSVLARLADGVTCAATFSEVSTHKIKLELHGSQGRLEVDCLRFDGWRFHPWGVDPAAPVSRLASLVHSLRQLPRGLRCAPQGGDYLLSHRNQWRDFGDCLTQARPVQPSAEAGLAATRVVAAAVQSWEQAATVTIS